MSCTHANRTAGLVLGVWLSSLLLAGSGNSQPLTTCSCSEVLLLVKQDVVKSTREQSLAAAIREFFCDETFVERTRGTGGNLKVIVPIGGNLIPFGASFTDAAGSQERRSFCSDKNASFSDNQAVSVFTQVLNPEVARLALDAYQRCIATICRPSGVFCEAIPEGPNHVRVAIGYAPTGPQDKTTPTVVKAEASNLLNDKGDAPPKEFGTVQLFGAGVRIVPSVSQLFVRPNPAEPVAFNVVTSNGPCQMDRLTGFSTKIPLRYTLVTTISAVLADGHLKEPNTAVLNRTMAVGAMSIPYNAPIPPGTVDFYAVVYVVNLNDAYVTTLQGYAKGGEFSNAGVSASLSMSTGDLKVHLPAGNQN